MQERHLNRKRYFDEQVITTEKYVIPFILETMRIDSNTRVLEIGCGEGGNLRPFLDIGCKCVGIDLSEGKIENAKAFFEDHKQKENIDFIAEDIYKIDNLGEFDLVFARDVLEHIHGQEKFMHFIKKFLKSEGKIFLGFPPWQNPFGGHQQMCRSKVLSKIPFLHLLPKSAYRGVMQLFKEQEGRINDMLEVKETRISIERFERILKQENYKVEKRCYYFINPNYEIKFGLTPREVWGPLAAIPYLRNFFITTNYYVLKE